MTKICSRKDLDAEVEAEAAPVVVADQVETPVAVVEEEEDDIVDLDEELHPDDVEEALDVVLRERTAAAGLEDDDEEDDEPDDRGEAGTKIVPRRENEFLCKSCFLVLPRHQLADEKRMICRDCVRAPRRPTVIRLGAAAASGVLCACSRPPFDLGPLAVVGLVPLFLAWRGRGARASAGYAFVAGAVYYAIVCSWIWYFGAIAIVPFVAICAGYWAAAGATIGWLRGRGVANPFLTAAVWVLADAVVARFPFHGFSWGELGYAFHDIAPARAVAGVGGLTLVTFLAVACNALARGSRRRRSARVQYAQDAGVAAIVAIPVGATLTRADPHVSGFCIVAAPRQ